MALYNIVKAALDNKIQLSLLLSRYYLNENMQDKAKFLYKKAIAIKTIDNKNLIYKIENFNDYKAIIKKGTISIYEPVNIKTNNFRILFKDNFNKNELFDTLLTIQARFDEVNISSNIIKSGEFYGLKFKCKENYITNKLYSFAKNITNGIDCDLNELKFGKLKRYYYSLNDNGEQDIIIDIAKIGEIC